MLALTLLAGAARYALDARAVLEVVPLVRLRAVPHAPDSIAGLGTWRGQVLPVIDLGRLLGGEPCPRRMSSRIIVARYSAQRGPRPLGLAVEQVVETRRVRLDELEDPGLTIPATPYLGRVLRQDGEIVQLVEVETLLPAELRELLFREADAT